MSIRQQLTVAVLGSALAGLLAPVAAAADAPAVSDDAVASKPAHTREVWVNFGGFSRHFAGNKDYNETNRGLGLEYRHNAEWSAMAGSYYNSVRRYTTYAAVTYQPFELYSVRVGASLGVMDGYPAMARGGRFFAALPMATYEGKRFGINIAIIPSMPKVDGAVVLQLKMRAY